MYRLFILAAILIGSNALSAEMPKIVAPGTKTKIEFPGHLTEILSDQHDTPSGTSVLELSLPPRTFGAPPHIHTHEDEQFYVLEGAVDFLELGETIRAETGSLVVLPRGHLHGFWNDTDEPARLLLVISPGGFSDFFDEVATEIRRSYADNPEAIGGIIVEAAAKRGIEIHFDKVPASAVHLLPQ